MNPLYEKYFLGEMSDDERRQLEQELAQNPGEQAQFEADRELSDLLKNQMLRRKINATLAVPTPPAPKPVNRSYWFFGAGLAALLLVLAWLARSGGEDESPQNWPSETPAQQPVQQQVQPSVPIVEEQEAPAQPATEPPKQQPGQLAEVAIEPHSLQGMRGSEGDSTPWGRLVGKIWYAPFPGDPDSFGPLFKPGAIAISKGNYTDGLFLLGKLGNKPFEVYKKEQADTSWALIEKIEKRPAPVDTLAFLRGYAMMRLWEGRPALYNFDQLSGKQHAWAAEVEWYAGLCHLLTGDKAKAVEAFKKIAAKTKHAYRKPANKALELLR